MIGSLGNLMFKLHINIKFPGATYHTIVPSTEELYCLNRKALQSILDYPDFGGPLKILQLIESLDKQEQ